MSNRKCRVNDPRRRYAQRRERMVAGAAIVAGLLPWAIVPVLDDVHRHVFTRIGPDVSCSCDFSEFVHRKLEAVSVRKVIGVAVVLKPAVFDRYAGRVPYGPMTHEPIALLGTRPLRRGEIEREPRSNRPGAFAVALPWAGVTFRCSSPTIIP